MSYLARSTDPITSHMAACNVPQFAGAHQARIIEGLKHLGNATAHELSALIGLSVVQIDRRLPELHAQEKTRLHAPDGCVVIRGGARVWELV